MTKFRIGTKVNHAGYRYVVKGLRGSTQRYVVRAGTGETVVATKHLKYWKKKRKK